MKNNLIKYSLIPQNYPGGFIFTEEKIKMMQKIALMVKSFGDCINLNSDWKQIRIHSTFRNVINLLVSSRIISIVAPAVGRGPNNIVVDIDDFRQFKYINWHDKILYLDDYGIGFSGAEKYDSEIFISSLNRGEFMCNLQISEKVVVEEAPQFSSAFLLDDGREKFFKTLFERNLKEKIKITFKALMNGYFDAVNELKGVGFGLTPQGDDIINGIVIALYIFEQLSGVKTVNIREKFYLQSSNGNVLSNTFIYYSSVGRFYEYFKDYLLAILSDGKNVESVTRRILNFGETSGADILTGFIISLKKFLEGGLLWQ
ncbi:MAG: hypothetical protein AUJ99_01515 [Caldisericum sp. CG2_30_36_11]|nr:MAG: hypothetical protein AUJ99_01515 [Caldisericum sp. CG2_30_36_11]